MTSRSLTERLGPAFAFAFALASFRACLALALAKTVSCWAACLALAAAFFAAIFALALAFALASALACGLALAFAEAGPAFGFACALGCAAFGFGFGAACLAFAFGAGAGAAAAPAGPPSTMTPGGAAWAGSLASLAFFSFASLSWRLRAARRLLLILLRRLRLFSHMGCLGMRGCRCAGRSQGLHSSSIHLRCSSPECFTISLRDLFAFFDSPGS
mmetsp:Transcript_41717/g.82347  ORF Transcript_41717/g.82347 Transcript_41717/m.82347 type:complete len:216 (-) Transcript_41717:256-903(-)